jgi:HEAT repeat protein
MGRAGKFLGVLGLAAAILAVTLWTLRTGRHGSPTKAPTTFSATDALSTLTDGMRRGETGALIALHRRLTPPTDTAQVPGLDEAEAVDLVEALTALRASFLRLSGPAKIAATEITTRILGRFTVPTPPAGWSKVLPPAHDILTGALDDPAVQVRVAALTELSRLWGWMPGCTMTVTEEKDVARWKEQMHAVVLQRLADEQQAPQSCMAAIACLGALAIDEAAAPALPYLRSENPAVRFEVLKAFGNRPNLLDVDTLLSRLHDPMPDLAGLAERLLIGRGLTPEEIVLGRLLNDPSPALRASAISVVLKRDDVDRVNVLLHLLSDRDASVRLQAIEACAGRLTPEVFTRLRELAARDESPSVRDAASKLAPAEDTAALPPLPGSPSLNPKAN